MISIVCPIYNEEKHIAKCVESILCQDYPKDEVEVIFVDGMSTDKTRIILQQYIDKYAYIKILDNPQKIVPFAMNIGIRASKGDIIIRLDAHAIFPSNYFSELVKQLDSLGADNVGGVCRTLPMDNTLISKSIAAVLSSSFGMGNSYFRIGANQIIKVDTVPFGCFRRSLFDKIGYFDEGLIRNQDDEFNGRIIKNNGVIYLLPNLIIDYFARDSIKKVQKMFYQYGLFKPLVNKKLGSPATTRQFFPLFFVLGVLLGPFFYLISPLFLVIYAFILFAYFVIGTVFSLKQTRNIKQILIQNYIFFIVHFSYGWGYIVGGLKLLTRQPFSVNSNR